MHVSCGIVAHVRSSRRSHEWECARVILLNFYWKRAGEIMVLPHRSCKCLIYFTRIATVHVPAWPGGRRDNGGEIAHTRGRSALRRPMLWSWRRRMKLPVRRRVYPRLDWLQKGSWPRNHLVASKAGWIRQEWRKFLCCLSWCRSGGAAATTTSAIAAAASLTSYQAGSSGLLPFARLWRCSACCRSRAWRCCRPAATAAFGRTLCGRRPSPVLRLVGTLFGMRQRRRGAPATHRHVLLRRYHRRPQLERHAGQIGQIGQ